MGDGHSCFLLVHDTCPTPLGHAPDVTDTLSITANSYCTSLEVPVSKPSVTAMEVIVGCIVSAFYQPERLTIWSSMVAVDMMLMTLPATGICWLVVVVLYPPLTKTLDLFIRQLLS